MDFITTAGLLVLASGTVTCNVPQPPKITVTPSSAPIQYEYNMTSEQLGRLKSNTVNPYAPGTDTTTGGLRHDRPKIRTEVNWSTMTYPDRQVVCMWYENIDVTIELNPKIYIASENKKSTKCHDAIKEHELKHVAVDRELTNKYALNIGQAIKAAVDQIGAMGPYNASEEAEVQERLIKHIHTAVDSQKFLMFQEMARRQGAVDSLEEYQNVSAICEKEER